MAEGKTPGNGRSSPFGNGKGAPEGGALAGAPNDFTKNPSCARNGKGASDFVRDPGGSGQDRPSVQDYTKAAGPTPRPEVKPNPQEIPAGGKTLYADPSKNSPKRGQTDGDRGRPFKLGK